MVLFANLNMGGPGAGQKSQEHHLHPPQPAPPWNPVPHRHMHPIAPQQPTPPTEKIKEKEKFKIKNLFKSSKKQPASDTVAAAKAAFGSGHGHPQSDRPWEEQFNPYVQGHPGAQPPHDAYHRPPGAGGSLPTSHHSSDSCDRGAGAYMHHRQVSSSSAPEHYGGGQFHGYGGSFGSVQELQPTNPAYYNQPPTDDSFEELPEEFLCPISNLLMAEPVIVPSGATYEKRCFQAWYNAGHRNCCKTGTWIEECQFFPNIGMMKEIATWCQRNGRRRPEPPTPELASTYVQRALGAQSFAYDQENDAAGYGGAEGNGDAGYDGAGGNGDAGYGDAGNGLGYGGGENGLGYGGGEKGLRYGGGYGGGYGEEGEEGGGDLYSFREVDAYVVPENLRDEDVKEHGGEVNEYDEGRKLSSSNELGRELHSEEHDKGGDVKGGGLNGFKQEDSSFSSESGGSASTKPQVLTSMLQQFSGEYDVLSDSSEERGRTGFANSNEFRQTSSEEARRKVGIVPATAYVARPPSSSAAVAQDGLRRGGGSSEDLVMRGMAGLRIGGEYEVPSSRGPSSGSFPVTAFSPDQRPVGLASWHASPKPTPRRGVQSEPVSESFLAPGSVISEPRSGTSFSGPRSGPPSGSFPAAVQRHVTSEDSGTAEVGTRLVYDAAAPNFHGRSEGPHSFDDVAHKLYSRHVKEQEEGLAEIRSLTRESEENRLALCSGALGDRVLGGLIELLTSRNPSLQINASASILNLSLETENKLKIARAGVIPLFVEVLQKATGEAQEIAAGTIFSLALNNDNKMAIGALGAISPLLQILRNGRPAARRDAAMALYHLSFVQMNRGKLVKAGAVTILLGIAQENNSDLISKALLILSHLALIPEGRAALSEMHNIVILVALLQGHEGEDEGGSENWPEVQEHAAAALFQLSNHNVRFRSQVVQAGAEEPLMRLAETGTQRGRMKASSLLRIIRDTQGSGEDLR